MHMEKHVCSYIVVFFFFFMIDKVARATDVESKSRKMDECDKKHKEN